MQDSCWQHPFVSVIVCTLPGRPFLERCLDSVLSQGCRRCEVLLVLNGAPQDAFADRLPGFPVRLVHEPLPGVCRARNRAVSAAAGELLLFADDDIVAHPGWLHGLVRGFDDPRVSCVVGHVVPEGTDHARLDRDGIFSGPRALSAWLAEPSAGWFQDFLKGNIVGFGCNMAFRKQFLERVAFPENLGAGSLIGAEDENYMFFQVLKRGALIFHEPGAVVSHWWEEDRQRQLARLRQIRAATVALRLKFLAEEPGYRAPALRHLLERFFRIVASLPNIRPARAREAERLLSPAETLLAHLHGIRLYWRSRRSEQ